MKKITTLLALCYIFLGNVSSQCSIQSIDSSVLIPLGVEGPVFQFSTAVTNPLPYTLNWTLPSGGTVLGLDASTSAALVEFPGDGVYTVCVDAVYDADGSVMCSECMNYTYVSNPSSSCGNVSLMSEQDVVTPNYFHLNATNLDSVDMASIGWTTPGGTIISVGPNSPNVTVEYLNEGTYTACFNYTSLSGEPCEICTTFDYFTQTSLPCETTIQYVLAVNGTYEYALLPEFSKPIIDSSVTWNTGSAVQVPNVVFPLPGLIQVDFGGSGLYTVCVEAQAQDGDMCSTCTDILVDFVDPDSCIASFTSIQEPQVGAAVYSFSVNTDSTLMDYSTIVWDLNGGTMTDPTMTTFDSELTASYPSEGIYTICLTAQDFDGNNCSVCQDVLVLNYQSQSCAVEMISDVADSTNYEYYVSADFLGDIDWNTVVWDLGGGTALTPPIDPGVNFQMIQFPGQGIYTVCASAIGQDGSPCSGCIDIIVNAYVPGSCTAQIFQSIADEANYIYDFYSVFGGDVDNTISTTWTYTGGTEISSNFTSLQLQFPGQGTYDICVEAQGGDGTLCTNCMTIIVEEYVPDPCVAELDYTLSYPSDYGVTVFANFTGDVVWDSLSWDAGGGNILPNPFVFSLNVVDIMFPDTGTYTVCASTVGVDGTPCSTCTDIVIPEYVAPTCTAGFWYYQDVYTGSYYFEGYTNDGTAPYTYDWTVQELGVQVSDQQNFTLDSINGLLQFTLCFTAIDANGDACDYCELIDAGTVLPPLMPVDSCIDWTVIDLTYNCPQVIDLVCGCDGITYENSCIAEQCFGVTQYTQGACPGYVPPGQPIDPNVCTGEFFYLGQSLADGSVELQFFGFGNNADDFIWDFGNGNTINGTIANLTLDSLDVLSSFTVCMTTISFWDTCSVSICETIVIDPAQGAWIEGYVFDNSDGIGGGSGQVERIVMSDGEAMPGVVVELMDWDNNILETSITDVEGKYSFSQLYFGDYHIHVNIDGAEHTPYWVELGPTSQFADAINFELTQAGNIVSGMEDLGFATAVALSPNPTSENVTLQLEVTTNTEVTISIMDMTGRILYASNEILSQGTFVKELEMTNFSSGIYLVNIRSGKDMLTKKIVKQ